MYDLVLTFITSSLVVHQQFRYGTSAQGGGHGNGEHPHHAVPRIGVVQRRRDGVLLGRVRHQHEILEFSHLFRAQVVDDRYAPVVIHVPHCLVPQQLQFDFLPEVEKW